MPVGQYADGSFWVRPVSGNFTLTATDPPQETWLAGSWQVNGVTGTVNRVANGIQVNPGLGVGAGLSAPQGYDSGTGANAAYDAGLNISLPYVVPAGQGATFVKAVSKVNASSQFRSAVEKMALLTVTPVTPAAGDFRPSAALADKTPPANVSHVDISMFQNIDRSVIPAAPVNLDELIAGASRYWNNDHTHGLSARNVMPEPVNMPDEYGGRINIFLARCLIAMNLNYPAQQKQALAIALCQRGLDVLGRLQSGGRFPPHFNTTGPGGGSHQHKGQLWAARIMLQASPAAAALNTYCNGQTTPSPFGTDMQFQRVAQAWVDTPRDPNSAGRPPKQPYLPFMVGTMEWDIQPFTENPGRPSAASGFQEVDGTYYRVTLNDNMLGIALAARLTTGGEAAWNSPNMFEYLRRHRWWLGDDISTRSVWMDQIASPSQRWLSQAINALWPAEPTGQPALLQTRRQGAWVWFFFDRMLREHLARPAAADFAMTVNGSPVMAAEARQYGYALAARLPAAPGPGDVVTLAYTPGANPVRTLGGTNVAAIAAQTAVEV